MLPFLTKGYVSESIYSPQLSIKILRDTGAFQSLLLEGIIDIKDQDSHNLGQGIDGNTIPVPLRTLYLK